MKHLYLFIILISTITFNSEILKSHVLKNSDVTNFKMYPNPAYGDEIYITTTRNGTKEIQVYDVFGEVVIKANINSNTLNISQLVPGIYIVQVTENNKTMVRKLVVK